MQPYKALALQTTCAAINNIDMANCLQHRLNVIHKIGKQISATKKFIGADLKLVVLPEYFTTGYPMGETIEQWQKKGCVINNGEEYKLAAKYAQENDVYISGNWYELDEHFENLYFQTSFIINNEGDTILRYRRLNSMYAPTPHDVLTNYIKHYGEASILPIVSTKLGVLACIASEEILYPEIARCLAIQGAEVLLHSTSEVGSNMASHKNIAKLARSIENMAYVVSANSAGIIGTDFPTQSTDAHSQIINYEGLKLCEAGYGESMVANATIHLEALRQHRLRPGMGNYLSRQRFEVFAPTYNKTVYPANTLLHTPASRQHFLTTQQAVITKLNAPLKENIN